jgi:hypothetical protein
MVLTAMDGKLVEDRPDSFAVTRSTLLSQPRGVVPDSVTLETDPPPAALLVRVLLPSTTS